MENNLIQFGSMTAMMRAREILRRHRIRSVTIRTPAALRNGSCGYSLKLNHDLKRAVALLRQNRVPYIGVDADDDN